MEQVEELESEQTGPTFWQLMFSSNNAVVVSDEDEEEEEKLFGDVVQFQGDDFANGDQQHSTHTASVDQLRPVHNKEEYTALEDDDDHFFDDDHTSIPMTNVASDKHQLVRHPRGNELVEEPKPKGCHRNCCKPPAAIAHAYGMLYGFMGAALAVGAPWFLYLFVFLNPKEPLTYLITTLFFLSFGIFDTVYFGNRRGTMRVHTKHVDTCWEIMDELNGYYSHLQDLRYHLMDDELAEPYHHPFKHHGIVSESKQAADVMRRLRVNSLNKYYRHGGSLATYRVIGGFNAVSGALGMGGGFPIFVLLNINAAFTDVPVVLFVLDIAVIAVPFGLAWLWGGVVELMNNYDGDEALLLRLQDMDEQICDKNSACVQLLGTVNQMINLRHPNTASVKVESVYQRKHPFTLFKWINEPDQQAILLNQQAYEQAGSSVSGPAGATSLSGPAASPSRALTYRGKKHGHDHSGLNPAFK